MTNLPCRERVTVLVAHPSPDQYGADLQMLQSIDALTARGWRVIVAVPGNGPLVAALTKRGVEVRDVSFPVLQRSRATLSGIAKLSREALSALPALRTIMTDEDVDVLYVNTVTIPWWLIAARALGIPSICHVHEAENQDSRMVQIALNLPLLMSRRVIVNSETSRDVAEQAMPGIRGRTQLIYNGVPGPPEDPTPSPINAAGTVRVALVGRLSPRKSSDVALEAVAALRRAGHDIALDVYGTEFSGNEWFAEQLIRRAEQPDLVGSVTWHGYVAPLWAAFKEAHIVVAPSPRESFGNVVVEAQLAARPVVAAAAGGHLESVVHESTGLLAAPGDGCAFAAEVVRLLADPDLAIRIATNGRAQALRRFSPARYHREVADTLDEIRATRRRRR